MMCKNPSIPVPDAIADILDKQARRHLGQQNNSHSQTDLKAAEILF